MPHFPLKCKPFFEFSSQKKLAAMFQQNTAATKYTTRSMAERSTRPSGLALTRHLNHFLSRIQQDMIKEVHLYTNAAAHNLQQRQKAKKAPRVTCSARIKYSLYSSGLSVAANARTAYVATVICSAMRLDVFEAWTR